MVMNKLQVKHSLLIATVLFMSSGLFAIENNFSNVRANNVNDVQVSNPNNIDQEGTWGTAKWKYDTNTQILTINGGNSGLSKDAPWQSAGIAENIKEIDVTGKLSLIGDMTSLFSTNSSADVLENLIIINGIDKIDTSHVTSMKSMFEGTKISSLDLSNWDTSNVEDMSYMFEPASELTKLDVGGSFGKNTKKVENMSFMFCNDNNLTKIDHLDELNTSAVTDIRGMFLRDSNLTNLDVGGSFGKNTTKVENMSFMFCNDNSLTKIDHLDELNTSAVTKMINMFSGDGSLQSLDLRSFDNQNANVDGMLAKTIESNIDPNSGEVTPGLTTLILGAKTKIQGSGLSDATNPANATRSCGTTWRRLKDLNGKTVNDGKVYKSTELTDNYNGEESGTYVRDPVLDASDYTMVVGDPTPTAEDFNASATDSDGKNIPVKVDLSKADLTKPGVYDVELSAGNLTKLVKLTVKEGSNDNGGNTYIDLRQTVSVPDNIKGNSVPLYSINDKDVKKIENRGPSRNSDWVSDRIIEIDNVSYLRVASNEWVKASDVYRYVEQHQVVWTISYSSDGTPYVMLKNPQDRYVSNRGLGLNTPWKTDRVAYLGKDANTTPDNKEENKYYRVATNEFVSSKDAVQK